MQIQSGQTVLLKAEKYHLCGVCREEAERKGREMAMLVAELQRMRADTGREAVGQTNPVIRNVVFN